jgi:hypothetical protein
MRQSADDSFWGSSADLSFTVRGETAAVSVQDRGEFHFVDVKIMSHIRLSSNHAIAWKDAG